MKKSEHIGVGPLRLYALGEDGDRFVVADGKVTLLDANSKPVAELLASDPGVDTLSFVGSAVRASFTDGRLFEWDGHTGHRTRALQRVRRPTAWAYSRDGTRVLVSDTGPGERPRTVLWDLRVSPAATKPITSAHVDDAVFNHDATHLFTISQANGIQMWDTSTGELLSEPEPRGPGRPSCGARYRLRIPVISQDGKHSLARNGAWNSLQAQDLSPDPAEAPYISDNEQTVAVVKGHKLVINGVGLLSGSTSLIGHSDAIDAVALDRKGAFACTGSRDMTARVWDVQGESTTAILKGHRDTVMATAFADEGRHVITGSWDRTARIWDLAANRHVLIRTPRWPGVLQFSADGGRFVARAEDGVHIYDTYTGDRSLV